MDVLQDLGCYGLGARLGQSLAAEKDVLAIEVDLLDLNVGG